MPWSLAKLIDAILGPEDTSANGDAVDFFNSTSRSGVKSLESKDPTWKCSSAFLSCDISLSIGDYIYIL